MSGHNHSMSFSLRNARKGQCQWSRTDFKLQFKTMKKVSFDLFALVSVLEVTYDRRLQDFRADESKLMLATSGRLQL